MTDRQLVLNLFSPPFEAWRQPGVDAGRAWSIDALVRLAQDAERALFDAIFLADSPSLGEGYTTPEPFTVLSVIAAHTTYLGLAPTILTTYSEPYNTARKIATLDQLTGGRVGWNAVTGSQPSVAPNFGPTAHPEHALRYERGEEYIEIVKALWDSWEPDAFVAGPWPTATLDHGKIRPVPFRGKHFQLDALFNVPRSPQGRPVIFHAGSSDTGRDQGARHADAIFTAQPTIEAAREFYQDFKRRVAGFGRNPAHALVLPGILPIIGSTEAEAQAALDAFNANVDLDQAIVRLHHQIGLDVRGLDLDAPIPAAVWATAGQSFTSRAAVMRAEAEQGGFTARQVVLRATAAFGHHLIVGTPEQVADDIELWFRTGAADGFNYRIPGGREPLEQFTNHVLPLLQGKGIFRKEYTARTLRGHYGLPVPPR
ncbi:NtaA/DmoA family FMN-dependent monooxygenase [Dactylosporangium sp. NPDC000555]|uniref:NtaA/DmoA family FMN-dependent monooxygenase n=1 Tax=Dactylosporangium sp. NPDC000555 TaxID=3154260 RepID=UPI00332CD261